MSGAAKRIRLDDLALSQGASDLARLGLCAPGTDSRLGCGVGLGWRSDGAQHL